MARASRSVVREYLEAALWALVLTAVLRAFVIQAFRIPSESMRDTLLVGDFLFVNKFEYPRFRSRTCACRVSIRRGGAT
jgi:signal peptidase I